MTSSPRPWKTDRDNELWIISENFPVCMVTGHAPTDRDLADAALIVRAVNAHDEAVELLISAAIALWQTGKNSVARDIDKFLERLSPEHKVAVEKGLKP